MWLTYEYKTKQLVLNRVSLKLLKKHSWYVYNIQREKDNEYKWNIRRGSVQYKYFILTRIWCIKFKLKKSEVIAKTVFLCPSKSICD
jgi:hypothetical protein